MSFQGQVLTAAIFAGSVTTAWAEQATLHVSFSVPLSCEVQVVSSEAERDMVVIELARRCNSRHEVIITSDVVPGLGPVSIIDETTGQVTAGRGTSISRSEQFTTRTDRIVLSCPDASPGATEAFLSTISVSIAAV